MYTRSCFQDETKGSVPENYDGNAFSEAFAREDPSLGSSGCEERSGGNQTGRRSFNISSLIERSPTLRSLASFLPLKKGDGEFKFGTEEILISAVALYMFFSKSGDKECAIMLLILLFIG